MTPIEDILSARRAIRVYLAGSGSKLPDETLKRLEAVVDSPSPVDQIARSAELLYAARDDLDDDGRTLVAQLASFAAVNGWHGMADSNRGGFIAQAMKRDMGLRREAGQPAYQKAQDDPAPAPEYTSAALPAQPAPAPAVAPDV